MSEVRFDEKVEDETRDVSKINDAFCHVLDASDQPYCGAFEPGGTTCQPYNGEAICPSCGLATCPTCAVMSSLNARLEEG